MVPDPRTNLDGIDPSNIHTVQELIIALTQVRNRAGKPALHELQRRAEAKSPPLALSRSTMSEVLRAKRAPTLDFLRAFLTVCDLDSEQLIAWEGAWGRARKGEEVVEDSRVLRSPPGAWYFPDQRPITIVCARLPKEMTNRMSYADSRDPDYVRFYTYADLDALVELYGHVRALNPDSDVSIRTTDDLQSADYTTHLVVLGGVDWNPVLRDIVRRTPVPVAQHGRTGDATYQGFFEVVDGAERQEFAATLEQHEHGRTLFEDVAHFFRAPSPYNVERTLTICNGLFARGTYGAVRALTDTEFRKRNEDYIRRRFPGRQSFSVLARVLIVNGEALTPDWSDPNSRLHEWGRAVD